MAVEKVEAFRTRDGRVFEWQREAEHHEARLDLYDWAQKSGICRGGEWSADMVLTAMLDSAPELAGILQRIKRA